MKNVNFTSIVKLPVAEVKILVDIDKIVFAVVDKKLNEKLVFTTLVKASSRTLEVVA